MNSDLLSTDHGPMISLNSDLRVRRIFVLDKREAPTKVRLHRVTFEIKPRDFAYLLHHVPQRFGGAFPR